jgi:hypothetical protein
VGLFEAPVLERFLSLPDCQPPETKHGILFPSREPEGRGKDLEKGPLVSPGPDVQCQWKKARRSSARSSRGPPRVTL